MLKGIAVLTGFRSRLRRMSSPSPCADRNLIFGLLALQMEFVTREQLLDAMHAWMLDKHAPVSDILRKRGLLNDRRLALLEELVAEHVAQHGGDAHASLAAVRVEDAVRADFHRLGDADVQASFAALASTPLHTTAGKSGHDLPANSLTGLATSAPAFPAPAGSRFHRLREHARGGLGEVFVALDEELHREVALKEIQDRFADTDEARARFVREAEITGNLEHPGVVPVYGLGTYSDGRPYYAMRFIQGQSLQATIDRFHAGRSREPSGTASGPAGHPKGRAGPTFHSLPFRELLGRFVAVCNTIAYAHNRGVIHRDLKPANVMLGEYGETLVVDWGLARLLDRLDSDQTTVQRPVAASAAGGTAPTQMGQVIGTPSFIPPEQAEGRLDQMGVASDVFSLGATLYALLTGQPPYQGRDVLGQARRADIVPARQRNRSVPTALEAVCGKAMAKRPQDRYPTAQALAQEIERWLADEPVQAYPEPRVDRLRRWGRRHRSVVWAGVVLLAAGVVGLSVGLWAVGREQQRTKEAARRAEQQKERAQQAEKETLEQYRAGTDDAIEQLIGSKSVLGPQEKSYLEKTLKRWQALADRAGDDERSRAVRAEGHFRVALLRHRLGQSDEAIAGYRQALALREKLADEFPDVPEYRKDLAYTHANLGILLRPRGTYEESARHSRRALAILQKLADDFPAVHDYRRELGGSHNNLGLLLTVRNEITEAAEQFRKALAIREKLVKDYPGVPGYQVDLGGTYGNYGRLLRRSGKPAESLNWLERAIRMLAKIHQQDPQSVDPRLFLRNSHATRALAYDQLERYAEAVKDWTRAIELTPPQEQPRLRADRANSQLRAGQVARAVAEVAELTKAGKWSAGQWYDFACILAVAAGKDPGRKSEHADRVMELLHKAVKAGYTDADHMEKDRDLEVLRQREDFKKLLAEVKAVAHQKTKEQ
jgi:serine/threonine-protein kinase